MAVKSEPITVTHPALASEWDYARNDAADINILTVAKKAKAYWLCPLGHSYFTRIDHRINSGSNCPVCAGNVLLTGFNDLATISPELASEWHPELNGDLLPSMVAPNTAKKVWWLCLEGHHYQATVGNRNNLGRGCPTCANQKILPGFNDMATTHPHLLTEWDYEQNTDNKPETVFAGTRKTLWWKCPTGKHSYQAAGEYKSNPNRTHGCSVCAGKQDA